MKKLLHCTLSSQTKETIAQTVGTDFATLQTLDDDQTTALIENKLGHKLRYPRNAKVGAYRVGKTIDEVDCQLTEITTEQCR